MTRSTRTREENRDKSRPRRATGTNTEAEDSNWSRPISTPRFDSCDRSAARKHSGTIVERAEQRASGVRRVDSSSCGGSNGSSRRFGCWITTRSDRKNEMNEKTEEFPTRKIGDQLLFSRKKTLWLDRGSDRTRTTVECRSVGIDLRDESVKFLRHRFVSRRQTTPKVRHNSSREREVGFGSRRVECPSERPARDGVSRRLKRRRSLHRSTRAPRRCENEKNLSTEWRRDRNKCRRICKAERCEWNRSCAKRRSNECIVFDGSFSFALNWFLNKFRLRRNESTEYSNTSRAAGRRFDPNERNDFSSERKLNRSDADAPQIRSSRRDEEEDDHWTRFEQNRFSID